MIINTENGNGMTNMPNMVKRGFNQTPQDIRDNNLANQLMAQKQERMLRQKEEEKKELDIQAKTEALNNLNNLNNRM